MSDDTLPPEITALHKRRRRYRKLVVWAMLTVFALAITPALFSHVLHFTLYGIALFGMLAIGGSFMLGRIARQLSTYGDQPQTGQVGSTAR